MAKLSWLAPNPDMMMSSTPVAVFKIIREAAGFELRALAKGQRDEEVVGVYASKAEAKAEAERRAS